jgi:hypothetical protein
MFLYYPIEPDIDRVIISGQRMAQTRRVGSVTKGRTDQKRRGFRPTELCSLPCGTGFCDPQADAHGQPPDEVGSRSLSVYAAGDSSTATLLM